ncbi:MAG: class I SAM-dependent methyltransferase [Clostridiales bacterium]|nr:class I SAM-dependent methyltransferase [Clostridiales bacterium]
MMKRLEALASTITPACVIADVGCDHGIIAGYCAKSGLATRIIASDISAACLDKARNALGEFDNVEFVCCDGIGYECDEAVIAGMGGLLICEILDRANADGVLPSTLALLPHRNTDSVRRKLIELGYRIDKDFMTKDRGKIYSIIRAVKTSPAQRLTELQYLYGVFCAEKCDILAEYLINQYRTYSVAPERNAKKLLNLRECLRLQGVDVSATDI